MALDERGSGIILPVYSLPSPYGIGTFGNAAYEFADFLKAAGQKYWQVLPLGPTGYGNSPYHSYSSFAGNPYFIDLDMLIEDGLLTREEVCSFDWGDGQYVDYDRLRNSRYRILELAMARGWDRDAEEVSSFIKKNEKWIYAYGDFMAVKQEFPHDRNLYIYTQYLFFSQWFRLKKYVNSLGIRIIGDIPIYVPEDSADFASEPGLFKLDSNNRPAAVAGVPPDYFSKDGQLWGNPVYDYDSMAKNGYEWWIRRIGGAAGLYDVIRIDHFRGFESYWEVPSGEKTAKNGRWVKGPGIELVSRLTSWFSGTDFIAEDLGILTPEVYKMLDESGLPGMKVLEFAFDENHDSTYLPHKYERNCVCYTGTHDNAPVRLWRETQEPDIISFCMDYIGIKDTDDFCEGLIRTGMKSVANTFICQMQDWLGKGEGSRTNVPGTVGDNWRWRLFEGETGAELAERIRRITRLYGR